MAVTVLAVVGPRQPAGARAAPAAAAARVKREAEPEEADRQPAVVLEEEAEEPRHKP